VVPVRVDAIVVREDGRAFGAQEAPPGTSSALVSSARQKSRRSFHVVLPLHLGVQARVERFGQLRLRGKQSFAEVNDEIQELVSPEVSRSLDSGEFRRGQARRIHL
jgi:hypothetical protein